MLHIPYFYTLDNGNNQNKILDLYRLIINSETVLIASEKEGNAKLVRSFIKNRYIFFDEHVVFYLNALTLKVRPLFIEENIMSVRFSKRGFRFACLFSRTTNNERKYTIRIYDLISDTAQDIAIDLNHIELVGWCDESKLLLWDKLRSIMYEVSMDGVINVLIKDIEIATYFHSPNEEGFIYTTMEHPNNLNYYDRKQCNSTVIVEMMEGYSFIPKINFSSTGNRFVCAIADSNHQKKYVTYDFTKKEVRILKSDTHSSYKYLPEWINDHSLIIPSKSLI